MTIPHEIEIKLAASPAMLDGLRAHPRLAGTDRTSLLVTTYFDTAGGHLRRAGASLRIRANGSVLEQTLKTGIAGSEAIRRGEWSVPAKSDTPDLAAFPPPAGATVTELVDGAPIEAVGTTSISRTTRQLHVGASAIEAAFETGQIRAGARERPVCELELELVEGKPAALFDLALALPLGPDLAWSTRSKAERCLALAFGLRPAAHYALPLRLPPAVDWPKSFQTIAWSCLGHLLANYPLVPETGSQEAIHQTRVALRRLRAACSVFGDLVRDDAEASLRAGLQAVAAELGRVRDFDVELAALSRLKGRTNAASPALVEHLRQRRSEALDKARAELARPDFQRLLFETARWLEDGEWLRRPRDDEDSAAAMAAAALSRRLEKLRHASGNLEKMSDRRRHKLRIAVKKLRYAAEFFESLYPGPDAAARCRSFLKALRQLQDDLGLLNDMATAGERSKAWFEGLEPILAARMHADLETILKARRGSRRKLLKDAERALEKALDVPLWWEE